MFGWPSGLGSGLQNLLREFNSHSELQKGKRGGWSAQYVWQEHTQDAGGEGAMHSKREFCWSVAQRQSLRLLIEWLVVRIHPGQPI